MELVEEMKSLVESEIERLINEIVKKYGCGNECFSKEDCKKLLESKKVEKLSKTCITITFGDCSENHVGMEKIGNISKFGYSSEDLDSIGNHFSGKKIERIDLREYLGDLEYEGEKAELLIIRKAIENDDEIFKELMNLEWDSKYYDVRRGKVLNKHARRNLCFSNYSQKADFENRKGTIVDFEDVKKLESVRNLLVNCVNEKSLECEGNLYENVDKNGIGWHGDSERKKVIALRLGSSMNINFNWFIESAPVGNLFSAEINSGDIYIMSEKTTGYDWKKRKMYTLRHSAGGEKYTKL